MVSDQMKQMLTDIDYPADKSEIMDMASKAGISQKEMEMLKKMPDQEYSDMSEVMDEMQKME
jgi:hypothetical protein